MALLQLLLSRGMQDAMNGHQAEVNKMTRIVDNVTKNISTVKCCNGEAYERMMYSRSIRVAAMFCMIRVRIYATQLGALMFMAPTVATVGLFYGGYLHHQNLVSVGGVISTFFSCQMGLHALQNTMSHFSRLQKALHAITLLEETLNYVRRGNRLSSIERGSSPTSLHGHITLTDV